MLTHALRLLSIFSRVYGRGVRVLRENDDGTVVGFAGEIRLSRCRLGTRLGEGTFRGATRFSTETRIAFTFSLQRLYATTCFRKLLRGDTEIHFGR